eukprot:g21940.t1
MEQLREIFFRMLRWRILCCEGGGRQRGPQGTTFSVKSGGQALLSYVHVGPLLAGLAASAAADISSLYRTASGNFVKSLSSGLRAARTSRKSANIKKTIVSFNQTERQLRNPYSTKRHDFSFCSFLVLMCASAVIHASQEQDLLFYSTCFLLNVFVFLLLVSRAHLIYFGFAPDPVKVCTISFVPHVLARSCADLTSTFIFVLLFVSFVPTPRRLCSACT